MNPENLGACSMSIYSTFSCPLAFLDTETTGLNPLVNGVVEVAVIRVQPDGTEERFHSFVRPLDAETYLAWAPPAHIAEAVRSRQARIGDAPPIKDIAEELLAFLSGCILVGQNIGFDEVMLNGSLFREGITQRVPYHKIDTKTLAFEHLFPEGLEKASMDPMREMLGLSKEGAHTAMKDTEDVKEVFELLFRR
jgi:DNA polymerase III alpha subunit (gram-positive type)